MTLPAPHKDWKLDSLLVTDAHSVGLDEMLTQLWLRVAYNNSQVAMRREALQTIAEVASLIEDGNPAFVDFGTGAGIAESWVRADLVKVLKRTPDKFAVARPVHLPATQLRNVRKDKDWNASAIPYQWIAGDDSLLEDLLAWLNVDISRTSVQDLGDLPSYALARLAEDDSADGLKLKSRGELPAPLCDRQGQYYRDDLRALLAYRHQLPRAVLVDHIQRITALHIFVHLMRTYRTVVEIVHDPDFDCGCAAGAARCAVQPTIVADCGDDPNSLAGRLAERSWTTVDQLLSLYVRAHLTLRKLTEFASGDAKAKRSAEVGDIRAIARLRRNSKRAAALAQWSEVRLQTLTVSASVGEQRDRFSDLREQYETMGVDKFDVYMALLFADGERRWFSYHRQLFDSLLAKNARDGAMQQPLGGRRRRRVALSPSLLESLALVSMVRFDGDVAVTRSIRISTLTDRLAERYGLLVASLPPGDEDAVATRAIIENHAMLRSRLRQAGLFVDLSDAFLNQTIRPRVEL